MSAMPCHWPSCRDNSAGACMGPCSMRTWTITSGEVRTIPVMVPVPLMGMLTIVTVDDDGNVSIKTGQPKP